jgi:hypothetical protein
MRLIQRIACREAESQNVAGNTPGGKSSAGHRTRQALAGTATRLRRMAIRVNRIRPRFGQ